MTGILWMKLCISGWLHVSLTECYDLAPFDLSTRALGRDVLNQLELTLNGPAQELWLA